MSGYDRWNVNRPKRPIAKTAHANQNGPDQNGPNERKNKTKTAPANIQNGPLRNIVQISNKW